MRCVEVAVMATFTSPGKRSRSCGKIRYRDCSSAKAALRRIAVVSTAEVIPIRWYECTDCHGVHLTSQPAWGVPAGAA